MSFRNLDLEVLRVSQSRHRQKGEALWMRGYRVSLRRC